MLYQIGTNVGLVKINKNASRGTKVAVQRAGLPIVDIDVPTFNRLPVRVVNLRQPSLRMQSAYKMFQQKGRLITQPFPITSFEHFVLSACRRPEADPHTMLQTDYLKGLSLTHILKWDFEALAKLLGTGPIPVIGSFSGEPVWTERAAEAFDRAYAPDLELWNGVA